VKRRSHATYVSLCLEINFPKPIIILIGVFHVRMNRQSPGFRYHLKQYPGQVNRTRDRQCFSGGGPGSRICDQAAIYCW